MTEIWNCLFLGKLTFSSPTELNTIVLQLLFKIITYMHNFYLCISDVRWEGGGRHRSTCEGESGRFFWEEVDLGVVIIIRTSYLSPMPPVKDTIINAKRTVLNLEVDVKRIIMIMVLLIWKGGLRRNGKTLTRDHVSRLSSFPSTLLSTSAVSIIAINIGINNIIISINIFITVYIITHYYSPKMIFFPRGVDIGKHNDFTKPYS